MSRQKSNSENNLEVQNLEEGQVTESNADSVIHGSAVSKQFIMTTTRAKILRM